MRSGVYETIGRPSVRPSVRRSISRPRRAAGLLLSAGTGRRYRSTAAAAGRPAAATGKLRSAANAGSVTLTADAGSWTQTCYVRMNTDAAPSLIRRNVLFLPATATKKKPSTALHCSVQSETRSRSCDQIYKIANNLS